MRDDMVMRSVYLRPDEDSALRQLAFDIKVTKSDLIRSAISAKLVEWLKGNDPEIILKDLELGRRLTPTERAEKARLASEQEAGTKAAPNKAAKGRTSSKAADRKTEVSKKGNVLNGKAESRVELVRAAVKVARRATPRREAAEPQREMAGAGA